MLITARTNQWHLKALFVYTTTLLFKFKSREKYLHYYNYGYHDHAELLLEAYYIERDIAAYAWCRCV
jgi:hypothetical protein